MKISHNNHSYLSPSKLNSLATVKTTLLSAASNTDDTYTTTTTTDLVDKLIIDKSNVNDNLTSSVNCIDDETNDNILSTMPTYTEYKSPYRDYLLGVNDNSIDYVDQLNGSSGDTDDALSLTPKTVAPFRFSDYTLDASSTTIRSTTTASIATPKTPDYLTTDFSPLNRCIQNIDDLLSFTATHTTTATTTTSSTLNSWNDANSEFARKELAHTACSTRKPLLSAQNRFLSLSISPPLSRRQDMPVLRGTFVSLSEPRSFASTYPGGGGGGASGIAGIAHESENCSLYGSDEEQEDDTQYCRGGYHPVVIGDVFDNRYRVVRKLGWGHFSTVWLCREILKNNYVALKVIKSAQHYTETAADEIRLLEAIRQNESQHPYCGKIVRLLNHFTIRGVNGVHTCLVFEALGCSLYKLIVKNNFQGLPIKMVKSIIRQVLQGLYYLHAKCGIIHTDIKPENILLCPNNPDEINRQIDNEITALKERNIKLPVSYVSASTKQKYDRDLSDPDISYSFSNYDSLPAADLSSKNDFDTNSIDSLSIQSDLIEKYMPNASTALSSASGHIKRYKMERKNSQQSQHGKQELSVASGVNMQCVECDPSLLELIGDTEICMKIADLGNACYNDHHFTEDIQTRQYRSIEVLLGSEYNYTADIWSTACLAFELLTGDYLFDPRGSDEYSRDEDHLAHIIELLGNIPPHIIFQGKYGHKYFNSYGNLRNITKLKPWDLYSVLVDKYNWNSFDAREFTDFLEPMLNFDANTRATAAQCLDHPWLLEENC
ncbi:SRSF protein kinase 3-like isoform X2 [Sitodiplosis mosellana]|uniref:SRSF protein kinase 3-like isoform X2 n=1 Tax=Sitodiplosis mosellana TaxID=263140 RepID=UPI0024439DD1|nr:SRSF protein kinase 3-like isoform X2 [Sitodiplosis mosellana]